MINNRGYRAAHGVARVLNAIASGLLEVPRRIIQRGAENYQDPSRSGNIPRLPVMGPLPPRQPGNRRLAIGSYPSGARVNVDGVDYVTPMSVELARGLHYIGIENPYNGQDFNTWSDGNTNNPRKIGLRRNTILNAQYF